jgi:uncharacterized membrane protein YcaP (DUF421 family)
VEIELFDLDSVALAVARAVILTAGAFAWTMLLVRMVGLRSFSKMTSFDFVATVATASLIAQAASRSDWLDYAQVLAAIGMVFLIQWALARLLTASKLAGEVIQNEPL